MTGADNGNTMKYRMDQLERNYDKVDGKLDTILTNHLPHIQQEIFQLKEGLREEMNSLRIEITKNTMKIGSAMAVALWALNYLVTHILGL